MSTKWNAQPPVTLEDILKKLIFHPSFDKMEKLMKAIKNIFPTSNRRRRAASYCKY